MLRTVTVTRYVTPLREGGSMPAIVEGEDCGTYVLKLRGAGQGPKALVAELLAGEIARVLGLPVPEIVLMQLDPVLGRSEPDAEIRALLRASGGVNLALDYLPGSIAFDPAGPAPDPTLAARIVWHDAFTMNVDRTPRNTNLLMWHRKLYLIDHGAALYFQHDWASATERARSRFAQVKDHVLLPFAGDLHAADAELAPRLSRALFTDLAAQIPDDWLAGDAGLTPDAARAAYVDALTLRLEAPRAFVEEAAHARAQPHV